MDRKDFIKNTLLGTAGLASAGRLSKASANPSATYDTLMHQVGFNHLPNHEIKTMKSVIHKAETRGHADHGWLKSHHSFSFANYYNPERMNFGVLRVLNDDIVAPSRGFGTHPHDNMEIISIPLSGDLEHKDSMGNVSVIKEGDIQVMSAGTGIYHSEYNKNKDLDVRFLQIWLFPNTKNVTPRYDQIQLDKERMKNNWLQILSPNPDDDGVWIHQDAWFNMTNLDEGKSLDYKLNDTANGVYGFILEGDISIDNQQLSRRDGIGIWDTSTVTVNAQKDSRILLMELPMQL